MIEIIWPVAAAPFFLAVGRLFPELLLFLGFAFNKFILANVLLRHVECLRDAPNLAKDILVSTSLWDLVKTTGALVYLFCRVYFLIVIQFIVLVADFLVNLSLQREREFFFQLVHLIETHLFDRVRVKLASLQSVALPVVLVLEPLLHNKLSQVDILIIIASPQLVCKILRVLFVFLFVDL